jgi:hypothetical protein
LAVPKIKPYIERAVDALNEALELPSGPERWRRLDEALRLTHMAVSQSKTSLQDDEPTSPLKDEDSAA